jgi:hypothetical protein
VKTMLLAACAAIAAAAPASACNVGPYAANPAGCNVYGAPMAPPPAYVVPPPPPAAPMPSMSFGTINGVPYTVNRLGGWTDVQIGE